MFCIIFLYIFIFTQVVTCGMHLNTHVLNRIHVHVYQIKKYI